MSEGYPGTWLTLWEDFTKDNVTNLRETVGSSATQDVITTHGGWWRQENDGGDADDCFLAAEVSWEVDEGFPLTFETRHQMSSISSGAAGIFAGMSDANTESSGILPYDTEGGSTTTTAADCFGFLADESGAGTFDATWSAVGTKNTSGNTEDELDTAPDIVASTPQVLRMIATPDGSGTVRYYIGTSNQYGGGQLVATKTSWFRSGIVFCPVLGSMDRAVNQDTDWDYIYVTAPRS